MSDPLYLAFRSSDVRNVLNHFSQVVSQQTLPLHIVDTLRLVFCAVGRICVTGGVARQVLFHLYDSEGESRPIKQRAKVFFTIAVL